MKWIVAATLLAALFLDWTRPPARQISVRIFNGVVIGSYRLLVRPVTTKFVRCRFRPTCSAYTVEAMKTHGFVRGLWLSSHRLVRCGPWTQMGTSDPVPAPR